MSLQRADYTALNLLQPLVSHAVDVEVKTSFRDKEDQIVFLREKRAEILKCIALIKAGIRKRNRPFQISMLLIMLGTSVYMINNWIKYTKFKNQQDDDFFHLFPPLKEEFEKISNQSKSLHNQYNKAFSIAEDAYGWLWTNNFRFTCVPPHKPRYNDTEDCTLLVLKWEGLCREKSIGKDGEWHPCEGDFTDVINIFNPCSPMIKLYCSSSGVYERIEPAMNIIDNRMQHLFQKMNDLIPNYDLFYQSIGGMAVYYLLTCGLGEISPSAVIMLTLLTHMFTNCLTSRFFSISEKDKGEILDVADMYDIESNFSSYGRMLKSFQNELPMIDHQLERFENRLAFCMPQKERDSKKTPLSLLFNDPNLRAPKLAKIIFDMAGIDEDSPILNASKDTRHTIDGSHFRGAQPYGRRINPLFSFFDKLKNQTSNVEEYDYKQGKNSPKKVLRNIYEFAGFVPVARR